MTMKETNTLQKPTPRKDEDQILIAAEVGQLIKKSEGAVWRMSQRDQLPHFKMGRNVRFRRSEILEYLANLEGVSTEKALNVMKRKR